MVIKAWRVGGSGWVTNNWHYWPWDAWGVDQGALHQGSLNLILQLGYYLDVPTDVRGEKIGNRDDTDYFLTPIRIRCIKENANKPWLNGFTVRKRDEPAEIRHLVEVVAPFIEGLSPCLKEPFEIDGPFKLVP